MILSHDNVMPDPLRGGGSPTTMTPQGRTDFVPFSFSPNLENTERPFPDQMVMPGETTFQRDSSPGAELAWFLQ